MSEPTVAIERGPSGALTLSVHVPAEWIAGQPDPKAAMLAVIDILRLQVDRSA